MSTKKIAHMFDFLISLIEIKPQFSREIISQNDLKKNFFLLYLKQMWKHVLFYGISVSLLFCFVCFLPKILKLFIENFVTKVNFSFASISLILFCSLFIFSILFNHRVFLRFKNDTEFFLQRYQISCRVFIPHYVNMQHHTFKYDAPLLFVHYALRLLPLMIITIVLGFMTPWCSIVCSLVSSALIFVVGYLKNKNNRYFAKIKEQSQKQKEFITNVEQSFDMIKSLSFFQYFQNNFSKFTREFSALYKNIMFNYNSLSSIKFFGIFLIFWLNITVFIVTNKQPVFSQFLSIVCSSFLIAYFLLSFLKTFDYFLPVKEDFIALQQIKKTLLFEVNSTQTPYINPEENVLIRFLQSSFVHEKQLVFNQVNQDILAHKSIAVIGTSVKERSLFLAACSGHLEKVGGQFFTPKKFEFVSQDLLILDGSIRDNILCQYEYNEEFYQTVIHACALDLEINFLPEKDSTLLQVNPSYFKSSFLRKICIARALYTKPKVLFLDEPFLDLSQDDAAQIFREGIQKLQLGTSVLFSTEKAEFAALSDEVLVLKEMTICEYGDHKTLLERNGLYSKLFYGGADNRRFEILQSKYKRGLVEVSSPLRVEQTKETQQNSTTYTNKITEKNEKVKTNRSQLLKHVIFSPYFFSSISCMISSIFLGIYAFYDLFKEASVRLNPFSPTFMGLSFSSGLCMFVSLILFKRFYEDSALILEDISKFYFVKHVLNLNQEPIGEKEKESVVQKNLNHLSKNFIGFVINGSVFMSASVLLFLINPPSFFMGLSLFLCVYILSMTINSKKETKFTSLTEDFRQLSRYRESFFTTYNQTSSENIRNFLAGKMFRALNSTYLKKLEYMKTDQYLPVFTYAAFCIVFTTGVAYFIFHLQGIFTLSFVVWLFCFALIFLSIEQTVVKFKRTLNDFEQIKQLGSVFANYPTPAHKQSLSNFWPLDTSIEFKQVKMTKNSEPFSKVLQANGRFGFEEKEQHTSALLTCLRFPKKLLSGSIWIDGLNLSSVDENDLRARIGLISNHSYISFLSVRENLDPNDAFDDSEIWEVLDIVGLSSQVASLKEGLLTKFSNIDPEMFWTGESILFSFARVLLNKNKLICIDHLRLQEDIEHKVTDLIHIEFQEILLLIASENRNFLDACCTSVFQINTMATDEELNVKEPYKAFNLFENLHFN